jgi:hypothetical protein
MLESPSRHDHNGDLVQYSLVTQTPNCPPSPALPCVTTTAVASSVATRLASLALLQLRLVLSALVSREPIPPNSAWILRVMSSNLSNLN